LSDLLTQPQESNTPPEHDYTTPDQDRQPSPSPSEGSGSAAEPVVPLPNFENDSSPDFERSGHPAEGPSEANLPDFSGANPASEPDEAQMDPAFKVSPAEPDWSSFRMAPLDEPERMAPEDSGQSWKTAWAVIREVGETILLTLIIFLLIQTVIRNFRVVGTSMVDNLHNGQYLIIDKLSYNPLISQTLGIGGPQRGDVIVFEPPNRPGEDYVKRIIGLPGETVEVRNGQVFINGQAMAEPFIPGPMSYTMRPQVVPEGTVFVLGDNRNNSNDSHNWGALPIENVVGRAWLSYWPPESWGTIPRDGPTEEATLKYFLSELVPGANAESEPE
jgi:signal peptidase I